MLERETVFVAEVEGAPAGYVAVERAGEAVRVDQLFVSPEHEAEGVGRQLLEFAEGYAISEGALALQVVGLERRPPGARLLPRPRVRPGRRGPARARPPAPDRRLPLDYDFGRCSRFSS